MSLRVKALLSSIIALLGLVAVSHIALQMILPSSFAQLEEQQTRKDIARALDALAVNLAQLESATGDWAPWDDTYDFIENANTNYIKANLTDSAFANLNLNVMVFVHSSGRIVFSKGYDLQNHKELPAPSSLQTYLTSGSYLTSHPDIKSAKTGIVSLPEGPLLVSAMPILTSHDEGPIRGTLIFGRFLNSQEIARLAQTTHLSLALHSLDDPQLPADFQMARAALSDQTPAIVRPLSEQTIVGYALIKDIYGKPTFILSTEAAREIYRQGQVSATYLMWALVVIGVTFAGIAFMVVERLFLTRITGLSQDVLQLGARGDPTCRVFARGGDEMSSLAREINQMLEVIQTSEQRYRALFEGAPMIIYALDTAGRFTALNPAFEQITGWACSEWLGRSFADIMLPQDLPGMRQVFEQALYGELPKYAERHILSKTGATLTVELLGLPQMVNGQVVGVTGFALDITERKHAEEALRDSEEKYRAFVENINEVIYTQDLEGRFTYVSPVVTRLSAYTPDDLIGRNFVEFIHPDDLPGLLESFDRTMRGEIAPFEYRIFDQNGEARDIRTSSRLIVKEGVVVGLTGVMTDFTERKRLEHALRESEERWRAYVEQANDLIFALDPSGRMTLANRALCAALGYTTDELVGKSPLEFVAPEARAAAMTALTRVFSGEDVDYFEAEVISRNQQRIALEIRGRRLLQDGKMAGTFHIARDITERKRAEEALRTSEEKYHQLFENATIGIFHSLPEGRFLRANPALARMLGYASPEEMVALVTDISTQIYVDSRRRGDLLTTTLEQSDWVYAENRYRRKDGGIITANLAVRKVLDAKGAVAYLEGLVEDITERQRAEEALRESEKRFRIIFEQAAVGVVLGNSITGEYFQINQKHCDIVGYTREEMLKKRFQDITYPDDLQSDLDNMKLLLEGKVRAFSMEKRYIRKDGSIVWVNLTVSPMWQPGEAPNYHIAIVEDITERKRAEAALEEYSEHLEQMVEARTRELRDAQEQLVRQERLAVLGQLAGGIAHELRSPLGAIKNAAYYFKMVVENPSPDAREMMDILDQQTDVSAHIIGSLLDFARPKKPTLQPVQLARVIEAAICQCTIPRNIAVVWQVDESSPSIKLDAGQMQLVFSNLITNAVQAMPQGGQLTIALQPDGNKMQVRFSDTGVGIPAEALDKVFQPLYTTKAKGIGLGLALTRIIVEAHGGTIGVMSEVGKGTTFTLGLPMNPEN